MHFLQKLFRSKPSLVVSISPQSLAAKDPRPRIVDVRERSEFTGVLGHIPDARSVPLATLEDEAATWRKDQPIVIVCRSGVRSAKAAELLVRLGFQQVFDLEGGTQAHVAAGFAVQR